MNTISYNTAYSHFAETIAHVCDEHEPVVIQESLKRSVVMLSYDDYRSLQETLYLLQNPTNASRLMDSIDEIESMIAANKNK
jgi:antitoxin YefM